MSLALRIIARLDIKGPNVVKGIQMEGLRVMGKPEVLAKKYASEGADELLYIDTVASLYGRNNLGPLLERTVAEVFIPITVGGGVRSREDVKRLLRSGADKVAINTAAIRYPALINECADSCGSQAIVVSIEAKRKNGGWECFTDNGREATGKSAQAWADEAVKRGAGELLITSVDFDDTRRGFDLELLRSIRVPVPVVACGGTGSVAHIREAFRCDVQAVAAASVLHYGDLTIDEIKRGLPEYELRRAPLGVTGTWERPFVPVANQSDQREP